MHWSFSIAFVFNKSPKKFEWTANRNMKLYVRIWCISIRSMNADFINYNWKKNTFHKQCPWTDQNHTQPMVAIWKMCMHRCNMIIYVLQYYRTEINDFGQLHIYALLLILNYIWTRFFFSFSQNVHYGTMNKNKVRICSQTRKTKTPPAIKSDTK